MPTEPFDKRTAVHSATQPTPSLHLALPSLRAWPAISLSEDVS